MCRSCLKWSCCLWAPLMTNSLTWQSLTFSPQPRHQSTSVFLATSWAAPHCGALTFQRTAERWRLLSGWTSSSFQYSVAPLDCSITATVAQFQSLQLYVEKHSLVINHSNTIFLVHCYHLPHFHASFLLGHPSALSCGLELTQILYIK